MRERLRPPFSFTRSSVHWLPRFAVVDRVNALYHCDTTGALYSAGTRWVAPGLDRVRRGASSTGASARLFCFGWLTASQIPRKHRLVAQNKTGHRTRQVSRKSFYRVVFQWVGRDMQTLYWNEPLEETRSLARYIAVKCEADAFQIFDFTGAEIASEKHPFQVPMNNC